MQCEDCIYYAYDEELDAYYCEQDLDEDEMARFLERRDRIGCPFYHGGNSDYYLSHKQ